MPYPAEERRYLVIMRVEPDKRSLAAATLMDAIKGMSTGDTRLAFSSERGETFGVFLKTKRVANQIRAELDGQYNKGDRTFVMVVEIGEDWGGAGNSRGWEWLQHH